jgi:CHRD domain
VADARVNGIRLYYGEHGVGAPTLCIHGRGSSARMWAQALEEPARPGARSRSRGRQRQRQAQGRSGIPLNAEQETQAVDSDASGFFSYTIQGDQLCYTLEVSNLTTQPIGAHIHPGQRNETGGIAVPLLTPTGTTSTVSACITAMEGGVLTPAELAAIAADPSAFYVNVRTTRYPGGEIRGQLK